MKRCLLILAISLKMAVYCGYSFEVLSSTSTPVSNLALSQELADTVIAPASSDSSIVYLNSIESGYRYESYNKNYSDRTFFYIQYKRTIKQVDLFAKVLQYRFAGFTAYQFETEAYWKFKTQGYAYFDAAYSDSFILPNYRLRAELFQNKGTFEYSIGVGVVKPFNFEVIPLLTGTLGHYFGDYFVYVRPTFTYVEEGVTKSIFVQGRRYFTKTDFVALSILRGADTGTSRDVNSIANSFGNDTYIVRINGNVKLGRYKIGAGFDYGGLYIPERTEYAQFVGFDIFINREF